jgi:hypothetical protein
MRERERERELDIANELYQIIGFPLNQVASNVTVDSGFSESAVHCYVECVCSL